MKTIFKLIGIACLFFWNSSCSEYEMLKFSEAPAVNFAGIDNNGYPSDEPSTLFASRNFGPNKEVFGIMYDTLKIGVKLEGLLSHKPLKVVLKANTVENTLFPEIILPKEFYIPADTALTYIDVIVKRPALYDTLYRAVLVFDHAQSDVQAGTVERQTFTIELRDRVTFDMLQITAEDWTDYYRDRVGEYGNVKIRFMIAVLKTTNFSNGFSATKFKLVRDSLAAYNAAHPDAPLKEANGELVKCDPIN